MTIYLYNPQKSAMYGKTILSKITGAQWPSKYSYLVDLARSGTVGIIYDYHGSSLPFKMFKSGVLAKFLYRFEFMLWRRINSVPKNTNSILAHTSSLTKGDALFVLAFEHLQRYPSNDWEAPSIEVRKFVHLTHYFFRTKEIASNVKFTPNTTLISEVDLPSGSPYFRAVFDGPLQAFKVLPFAVSDRFRPSKSFSLRESRAVAVGSFMTFPKAPHTELMCNFYETNTIHPLRKEIWEKRNSLAETMNVKITYINDFHDLKKPLFYSCNSLLNNFTEVFVKNIIRNYGKSDHFRYNIVDLYNDFQMVISTSENGELPSIGTFEAMACGCAALCSSDVNYDSIGLQAGVHFVEFNGTFDDLVEKIKYYQVHPDELAQIAKNGEEFVRSHFMAGTIKDLFVSLQ